MEQVFRRRRFRDLCPEDTVCPQLEDRRACKREFPSSYSAACNQTRFLNLATQTRLETFAER